MEGQDMIKAVKDFIYSDGILDDDCEYEITTLEMERIIYDDKVRRFRNKSKKCNPLKVDAWAFIGWLEYAGIYTYDNDTVIEITEYNYNNYNEDNIYILR